jgi:hypothetical protein
MKKAQSQSPCMPHCMSTEIIFMDDATDLSDVIGGRSTEEITFGNSSPSYVDLAEENAYLRAERSQLYSELATMSLLFAQTPEGKQEKVIEGLENELSTERDHNEKLLGYFEFLKGEITHLLTASSNRTNRSSNLNREKVKERGQKALYYREYKRKGIIAPPCSLHDKGKAASPLEASVSK